MRITKTYKTETAHRLMHHAGACSMIHGHSYKYELTIEGEPDDVTGMLIDFGDLKSIMDTVIGDNMDHALVLNADDPLLKKHLGVSILVLPCEPTAENIAKHLLKAIREKMSLYPFYNIKSIKLKVQETDTAWAEYEQQL